MSTASIDQNSPLQLSPTISEQPKADENQLLEKVIYWAGIAVRIGIACRLGYCFKFTYKDLLIKSIVGTATVLDFASPKDHSHYVEQDGIIGKVKNKCKALTNTDADWKVAYNFIQVVIKTTCLVAFAYKLLNDPDRYMCFTLLSIGASTTLSAKGPEKEEKT